VPVTVVPLDVSANTVEPADCIFNVPELSALVDNPPAPLVIAFIIFAIYFPL
jgi:hypothetical protein